jgi:hypothetical protein
MHLRRLHACVRIYHRMRQMLPACTISRPRHALRHTRRRQWLSSLRRVHDKSQYALIVGGRRLVSQTHVAFFFSPQCRSSLLLLLWACANAPNGRNCVNQKRPNICLGKQCKQCHQRCVRQRILEVFEMEEAAGGPYAETACDEYMQSKEYLASTKKH